MSDYLKRFVRIQNECIEIVYEELTNGKKESDWMDYIFPQVWDMEEEATNTSILYIADERLKEYYVAEALRFMEHELDTPNIGARCMVFAEQRILPMCAKELGVRVNDILKFEDLEKDQDLITHVWSAKPLLQNEKEAAEEYVRLCEKIDGVL